MYGEKVPSATMVPRSRPSLLWCRAVWSVNCRPPSRKAPRSQTCDGRLRQDGHLPHEGMKLKTTWSPTARSVTPSPISMTSPAPSWPPMTGNWLMPISSAMSAGSAKSPVTMCSSEWHRPEAASLTSTSPFFGGSSSMSSTLQSVCGSHRIAARVCIEVSPK